MLTASGPSATGARELSTRPGPRCHLRRNGGEFVLELRGGEDFDIGAPAQDPPFQFGCDGDLQREEDAAIGLWLQML